MREWPWYAYVVIAVIIFGLFFLFYYRPKNDELESIRAQRIQTENEVVLLKQKKEQLDQIEAELQTLNVKLSELEAIIPLREEIDVILKSIQQLAFDSRLDITKFISQALVDQEFYSEKPINIEISGNYHNLAIFFNRLSNFARLFIIDNFTIRALRDQSDTATITSNYTAKTFVFKEADAEPAPKTKRKKK